MSVKSDVRYVNSKRDKTKKVKKTTYKCEGSYVDIDGVPHRYHKRGFSSAEEAKEWERTFLLKATNEVSNNLTYGDLFQIYKDAKKIKLKDRSYYDMTHTVESHILPFWKKVSLSNITLKKIETWQLELLSKTHYVKKENGNVLYSNRYLETIQTQFKSILKYGITMGYITDVRLSMFELQKRSGETKKEMLFWQPDEFMKFINEVDRLPYKALFCVLYWCGLRLGEALALNWSDVNFSSKTIKVNKSYTKHGRQITTPKTENSIREIIIPNKCFETLEVLHELHMRTVGYHDKRLVFNFDKPMDENAIRLVKNRCCKAAHVKEIRIHDFRHSHVSLLVNLGFNPFDIAKRLGHTVEMVNNVYGHWFTDAQQKMVDRLNDFSKNLV